MLRIGLVGCGDVARKHVQAIRATGGSAVLGWVHDHAADRGLRFASQYGCRFVSTRQEAFRAPADLVIVSSPNRTHFPLAAGFLRAGTNVLVEHPLATRVDEARQACELAACHKAKLFVTRQRRFLSSVQRLRGLLLHNRLGTVRKVSCGMIWNRTGEYYRNRAWRADPRNGGVLMNQASHFIDGLLYLFGSYQSVRGRVGNIKHRIPVEDTASGTIRFESGVEASFRFTTGAPESCNVSFLHVAGDAGSVVLGGRAWDELVHESHASTATLIDHAEIRSPQVGQADGDHAAYLRRVLENLRGSSVEVVTGCDGLQTAQLIEDAYGAFSRDDNGLRTEIDQALSTILATAS